MYLFHLQISHCFLYDIVHFLFLYPSFSLLLSPISLSSPPSLYLSFPPSLSLPLSPSLLLSLSPQDQSDEDDSDHGGTANDIYTQHMKGRVSPSPYTANTERARQFNVRQVTYT